MKKRILSLLILLSATTATMAYNSLLAKLVKTDYEGKADSLTKVFIKEFMNTSKGTFWVTPKGVNSSNTYIYWQQAHSIDVVIYAYQRNLAAGNQLVFKRTAREFKQAQLAEDTERKEYLTLAQSRFNGKHIHRMFHLHYILLRCFQTSQLRK